MKGRDLCGVASWFTIVEARNQWPRWHKIRRLGGMIRSDDDIYVRHIPNVMVLYNTLQCIKFSIGVKFGCKGFRSTKICGERPCEVFVVLQFNYAVELWVTKR
jgi:hypothetical protein